MALGRRAVVQVDGVGAVGPRPGARAGPRGRRGGPDARSREGLGHDLGVPRMVRGHQPRPDWTIGHRDAEPGVDLGELAARRAAAQDEQAAAAARGPGSPRGWSRPGRPRGPAKGGTFECEPTATTTFVACQLGGASLVERRRRRPRRDAAPRRDTTIAPASSSDFDVPGVVGLVGVRRAVDHPVAARRGLRATTTPRDCRVVPLGRVEERLRREAADVRAAAAEPAPVDDRDARAALARLERRRLAGRSGADDHEVEARPCRLWCLDFARGRPRWRQAS